MDLAELDAAEQAAAEAIGVFESEYAANEAEWKARRLAVNDAYRAAAAALQTEVAAGAKLQAALATVTEAGGQVILPDGLSAEAVGGEVG